MSGKRKRSAQELHALAVDADVRCRQWLARATDLRLAGKREAADRAERKAQYWLDKQNTYEGRN